MHLQTSYCVPRGDLVFLGLIAGRLRLLSVGVAPMCLFAEVRFLSLKVLELLCNCKQQFVVVNLMGEFVLVGGLCLSCTDEKGSSNRED